MVVGNSAVGGVERTKLYDLSLTEGWVVGGDSGVGGGERTKLYDLSLT